jgi:hypothetical protein
MKLIVTVVKTRSGPRADAAIEANLDSHLISLLVSRRALMTAETTQETPKALAIVSSDFFSSKSQPRNFQPLRLHSKSRQKGMGVTRTSLGRCNAQLVAAAAFAPALLPLLSRLKQLTRALV